MLGLFVGCGQAKGDAGFFDGLLGAADALRHGCFGDEKGMGDFDGLEAAYCAEGESDCRRRGERGMAAHEEEDEGVVFLGAVSILAVSGARGA